MKKIEIKSKHYPKTPHNIKKRKGRQSLRPSPSYLMIVSDDYIPKAFLASSLLGLTFSTLLKYSSASGLLPFFE